MTSQQKAEAEALLRTNETWKEAMKMLEEQKQKEEAEKQTKLLEELKQAEEAKKKQEEAAMFTPAPKIVRKNGTVEHMVSKSAAAQDLEPRVS